MELYKSVKTFLLTGVIIFLIGFGLHNKEIGDFIGMVIMISGGSLIVGAIVMVISKWLNLNS